MTAPLSIFTTGADRSKWSKNHGHNLLQSYPPLGGMYWCSGGYADGVNSKWGRPEQISAPSPTLSSLSSSIPTSPRHVQSVLLRSSEYERTGVAITSGRKDRGGWGDIWQDKIPSGAKTDHSAIHISDTLNRWLTGLKKEITQ